MTTLTWKRNSDGSHTATSSNGKTFKVTPYLPYEYLQIKFWRLTLDGNKHLGYRTLKLAKEGAEHCEATGRRWGY